MDGFLDIARCYSFCDICKTGYDTDYHAPMALPCFHAVCKKCLMAASEQMIQCPNCKTGPNDHRISADIIKEDAFRNRICKSLRISRNEIPCTDCPDNAKAQSYCTECQIYLCDECVRAHNRTLITRKHRLETPFSDSSGPKDSQYTMHCSFSGHEKEVVEYYCENARCQKFVCRLCLDHHRKVDGHIVLTVHDAVKQSKDEIRLLLGNLEETVSNMNASQTKINREILDIEIKENEALRDVEMAVGTFRRVLELKYQDLRDIIRSRFQEYRRTVEPLLENIQHFQMIVEYTNTFLTCVEAEANAPEILAMQETISKRLKYLYEYRIENSAFQTFDLKIETQPIDDVKRFISGICRVNTHQTDKSPVNMLNKNSSDVLISRQKAGHSGRPTSIDIKPETEFTSTTIPRVKFLTPQGEKAVPEKTRSLSDSTTSHFVNSNTSASTSLTRVKGLQRDDKSPTNKQSTSEMNGSTTRPVLQSPRSYASPKVDISPKLARKTSPVSPGKTSPILTRARSTSPGSSASPRRWSPPSTNLSKLPSPVRKEMNSVLSARNTLQNENLTKLGAKKELRFSENKLDSKDTEKVVPETKEAYDKNTKKEVMETKREPTLPDQTKKTFADFSDLYDMRADDAVVKSTTLNNGLSHENHTSESSTNKAKITSNATVQFGNISCPEFILDSSMVHEEREVSKDKKTLSNRQPKKKISSGDSDEEDGFFLYKGTVGTQSFKEIGKFYFEVNVVYSIHQPLEQTWMVFEIGLCRMDDIDCYHSVERHPKSRSFYVARFPEDGKLAQEFWHNRQLLECISLSNNRPGIKMDVLYGHLIDTGRKTWTVINCSKNKVLYTFENVDFSEPLFPVFGTYNPELVSVELTLKTGTEAQPKNVSNILKH